MTSPDSVPINLNVTRPVRTQDSSPDSILPITLKLKNFVHATTATNANTNTGGSALAVPVHSYRQDKNSIVQIQIQKDS